MFRKVVVVYDGKEYMMDVKRSTSNMDRTGLFFDGIVIVNGRRYMGHVEMDLDARVRRFNLDEMDDEED